MINETGKEPIQGSSLISHSADGSVNVALCDFDPVVFGGHNEVVSAEEYAKDPQAVVLRTLRHAWDAATVIFLDKHPAFAEDKQLKDQLTDWDTLPVPKRLFHAAMLKSLCVSICPQDDRVQVLLGFSDNRLMEPPALFAVQVHYYKTRKPAETTH